MAARTRGRFQMMKMTKGLLIFSALLLCAWQPCRAGESLVEKAAQWAAGATEGAFPAARAEELLRAAGPAAPAAKVQEHSGAVALKAVVCSLKGLDGNDCVYRCSDGKERRQPSNSFPGDEHYCPPFIFPF
ncbi:MAG: hypothetical protein PHF00_07300 [Elusimicrobia bacterium]|nr:hypothetical protein [Elusimicrobiota bacterium]